MNTNAGIRLIDRRKVVGAGSLALASLVAGSRFVSAHDHATPAASPVAIPATPTTDPGMFPSLQFRQTADALIIPATFEAGIYHITFTNDSADIQHTLFLRLPDGTDEAALQAAMEDPEAPFPEWGVTTSIVGVPDEAAPNGGVREGFSRFVPGIYYALDIFGGRFARIEVTGEMTDEFEPQADFHVSMVEMTFLGLEGHVPAGRNLWKISNDGLVPHEFLAWSLPPGKTVDQIIADISDPSLGDLGSPEGYAPWGQFPAAIGIQSAGSPGWVYSDFAPGSYAAFCFAPDQFAGPPHAIMGMITPFTVE
jgi:hypothetical protein